ncbi:hypothetical protein CIL05_08330 [Virgibacillus profundi]|uniref:Peptidyl-prolyl cis-trans isomerase n=1 Tax=Virgibacillus profundi TaxID=2024555 RepID=A0A2A2IEZ2_9BACI|nr:hypothetical protein [Virgibacillus profundi]PAV29876.1 hypothetical protein CIL05_08330 [Virgibacillus profundi]PXY54048.1 hypothetical protein CIT14_08415 [Virgibacillus profundi]
MIVPMTGNVTYPITLDPTVWIFDDRKILLEDAFTEKMDENEEIDELEKAANRFNKEVFQISKPPVNRSIKRFEREKILKSSYVMPLDDFIANAEVKSDAKDVILVLKDEEVTISLPAFQNSYFLFAVDGKPLKEDGPVHLYYKDGSNKEHPIKNIGKVIIN